ncbi:hypothetical protein GCM10019059_39910 [Camelimonas fluminis]|nr:hypothetical protein GCM10019059_39910 [Camelimonas fluminis]
MASWTAMSIAQALSPSARKSGQNWLTRCPAHADDGPSLSLIDGKDGRVIFNCLAGCDFRDVSRELANLGFALPGSPRRITATAVKPPEPQRSPRHTQHHVTWDYAPEKALTAPFDIQRLFRERAPLVTSIWDWMNKGGELLFRTARLDDPERGKSVVPITPCICRHTNKVEWRMKGPDGPRPLYNLQNLTDQTVAVVTEGEKVADAVRNLFRDQPGVWVTTTLGGAKSPHLVDWSPVAGLTVVVAHDYDAAGLAFAAAVAENARLHGAISSHLWTPPVDLIVNNGAPAPRPAPTPAGFDLFDAAIEGWTLPLLATLQHPWHGPEIVSWSKISA